MADATDPVAPGSTGLGTLGASFGSTLVSTGTRTFTTGAIPASVSYYQVPVPEPTVKAAVVATSELFTLDFAIKSSDETTHDGVPGLLLKGYASLFNQTDLDQEYQVPGSFADIAETWGAEAHPMIYYQHGLDADLTTRRIGTCLNYVVDKKGLWVEVFIPALTSFTGQAKKKFAQVYARIKSGAINGFSVGGTVLKMGKALLRWSMSELSVTPNPCLPTATFTVGTKSVRAVLGAQPSVIKLEGDAGDHAYGTGYAGIIPDQVPPDAFSSIMRTAQQHNDHGLHDHLLARAPEHQGAHDAQDCGICAEKRGDKMEDGMCAAGVGKATDGEHGYLVTEPDGTGHLPTKKNGTVSHTLMGDAWAALHEGFRGNPYSGPDKAAALAKLKRLYATEGLDVPESSGKARPQAAGDWVEWDTAGAILRGRIVSLHQAKVPGVPVVVYGSDAAPAARVEVYQQTPDGFAPTGFYIGSPLNRLTKVDALVGAKAPVAAVPPAPGDPPAAPTDLASILVPARALIAKLDADRKVGRRHSKDTLDRIQKVMTGLKSLHTHLQEAFGVGPDAGQDENLSSDAVQYGN